MKKLKLIEEKSLNSLLESLSIQRLFQEFGRTSSISAKEELLIEKIIKNPDRANQGKQKSFFKI